MQSTFDRSRSLQELESADWGEPTFQSSLVINVHRLRRRPLQEFTPGDLRLFIGQNLSLEFLIPLALEVLEEDPLVEGSYFPADLLLNVAQSDPEFWKTNLSLLKVLVPILERGIYMLGDLEWFNRYIIDDQLESALERHKQILRSSEQSEQI